MNPIFAPPRLRANRDGDQRHATWLESFYDLVFAVTLFGLVTRLHNDSSLGGIGRFLLLFLSIWWAWVGQTVYLTRFDTDDVTHRFVLFLQMLAASVMTTQLDKVFEANPNVFGAAYLFVRCSLLVMYGRARFYIPEARHLTSVYLAGFGAGAAIWAVSLFAPPPFKYVLWTLSLAVDFAVPWIGQPILKSLPVDAAHLPERFAQFNLIVLGEIVYEVITSLASVKWSTASITSAILIFSLAILITSRYFIYTERERERLRRNLGPGQSMIYSHLPYVIGLAVLGAGASGAIQQANQAALNTSTLWLMVGGMTLCLLATVFIQFATTQSASILLYNTRNLAILATLLIGIVGIWLPPLFILILFVIMSVYLLVRVTQKTP